MPEDMEKETVTFHDGSTMDVLRNSDMDESQWLETKMYLESNVEEARALEEYNTNPNKIRKELLMRAISESWQRQIDEGDDEFSKKIKAIEEDPDFEAMFAEIKAYNADNVKAYYENDELMMRVSKKMGGVPRDVKQQLDKIRKTPITLQEACKFGDIKALQKYLAETESDPDSREIDARDQKGITCLGYAVGANRTAIAKLLIEVRADAAIVDYQGNSALHYAACYGRKDMVEYLAGLGLDVNATNTAGLTPLQVATKNKQAGAVTELKAKGAK